MKATEVYRLEVTYDPALAPKAPTMEKLMQSFVDALRTSPAVTSLELQREYFEGSTT